MYKLCRVFYSQAYLLLLKVHLYCIRTNGQVQIKKIYPVKINSIDDKNATVDFATAMDEIITPHSEDQVYRG